VRVRVVDGDTGAPLAGARLRAVGPANPATAVTGPDGIATLPAGTGIVRARAAGHEPGGATVRGATTMLRLYDPSLQSPQYGGGPARGRHVPAVALPPPRRGQRPDWTFDGRTLAEFPPAVAAGLVIHTVNSGRVFALDARTGAVRWARRQRGAIAASPAIAGGRVYVASMDGRLTAYRLRNGRQIWQIAVGSPIETSPLVIGEELYFGAWNGNLYSVNLRTGRLRWTVRGAGAIKGSAAQAGRLVIVGDYGGVVRGIDRRSGREVWRAYGTRFYGGPGVSGSTAVIGDVGGAVTALDARSGRRRWRVPTGGYVYSSPAIADGTVYIGSYAGRFMAIDLDSGRVRWSFNAGGRISGSATVVGKVVYTAVLAYPGQAKRTWGLDVRNGAVRYSGGDGRYSPAVAAGRTLYLVGSRRLYAYRAPEA
jgi:outer membrane protein assembly factor BamB